MASSFSTDLKLELMVTGENAGTWGTKTNTNLNLLQQAIAGYQSISIAGGAQTTALTMDNAAISNARNAVIELTGTITGNQVVTIPNGIEKTYIIFNNTVGAFTVQFKTASGTGYTFATTDKTTRIFYSNGTNIIDSLLVNTAGIDTLTNKTLTSPRIGTSILDTNGNELALLTATASAVNEITLANSATGASPTISATGSDTNIGINLTPKGTGGIVLGAGAVGTPALTTSGDLNTGIFFPAADTIAFTEGGAEAMRINSSGNVGIGTTSVDGTLHLKSATPSLIIQDTGTHGSDSAPGLVYKDSSSSQGEIGFENSGEMFIRQLKNSNMTFRTNNTERMRITSDGKVLIGQKGSSNGMLSIGNHDNPGDYRLNIEQLEAGAKFGGSFYVGGTGAGNQIRFGNDLGTVGSITTNSAATAFNTSSDYRLKENVNYNFDATTRLKQLKPARFNFIKDANKTVDGFLAHEVQSIIPEAITGTKDATVTKEKVVVNVYDNVIAENIEQADWETGKIADEKGNTRYPIDSTWEASKVVPIYQGIDQAKLTPLLTKALQEAIAKIESLEARLTALES
jgi:hypothetical protein